MAIDIAPLINLILRKNIDIETKNKAIKGIVRLRTEGKLRDNRGISSAFDWYETEEGEDFWYKLKYAPQIG